MKFIPLLSFVTLFVSIAGAQNVIPDCDIKEKPEWRVCTSKQRCVVVAGACDSFYAVNSKFKKDAESFHACEGMRASCVQHLKKIAIPTAKCVTKICVLVPRTR